MSDAEIAAKLLAVLQAECDSGDLATRLCIVASLLSGLLREFQQHQQIDPMHGLLAFTSALHDKIGWIRRDRGCALHLHEAGNA